MTRYNWSGCVLGLASSLCAVMAIVSDAAARQTTATASRPNVVLIITDDQGFGDLGCYGNPVLETPHLDRLYQQSVRLTNFHTDPTCSPTRAALMTGRYSTRTGVWHTVMGRHMPHRDEIMIPRAFSDSGYRTAIFGKWHLGDAYPFRPQDRGFDEVLIHGGGGVGQIPDYWGNDYFDDTYLHNGQWRPFNGYCTDVFFREASKFIAANRERPFFVYLSTNAPHGPYLVEDRYSRPYQDRVGDDAELANFYGMIANIDENVGRLLNRLDELQLADKTIVIFMTDNGTARGATFTDYRGNDGEMLSGYNAGMRGRKGSPYEGGHRAPCFLRWPEGGLTGGRDVERLTAHLDLFPTLIDLCRLELPARPQFDGVSLVPLLKGQARDWPQRTLFAHHQELPRPEKHRFACVMNGSWRLILRNDLGESPKFELYDVAGDPGQEVDLLHLHADTARRMREAYDGWWNELSAQFDEFSEIIVGDARQDPTRLTCFEWHGSRRWWQNNVRSGTVENGFWALKVQHGGNYQIQLRRWPDEVELPLTASVEGGRAIPAVKAKIQIGAVEADIPVPAKASGVTFKVQLEAGPTRLQTWLTDADGRSRGAYYVTIGRVKP